jgi:FKBP-type peptidyl-prolyl cis-trans isomerase
MLGLFRKVVSVFFLLYLVSGLVHAGPAEDNLKTGTEFLQANAAKQGVQVAASGLQYFVISEGSGASPRPTDRVTVNYRGSTITGKVFDQSSAISFGLNRVIRGWTEGLQLMKVGAKYRFFIPSDLAYGQHGAGSVIGPNEALIFDVELLSVKSL